MYVPYAMTVVGHIEAFDHNCMCTGICWSPTGACFFPPPFRSRTPSPTRLTSYCGQSLAAQQEQNQASMHQVVVLHEELGRWKVREGGGLPTYLPCFSPSPHRTA